MLTLRRNFSSLIFSRQCDSKKAFSFTSTITPKEILTSIEKKLKIDSPEKWYLINPEDLKNIPFASELVNHYGDLYKALSSVYKDANFLPWKFVHFNIPHGFWKDVSNQRLFLQTLGEKLGYKHWSDWYNITAAEISAHGGTLTFN